MTQPEPTPEQAVRVLEILCRWSKRGWSYEPTMRLNHGCEIYVVGYSNPQCEYDDLWSEGCSPFDALCQATTVMQVLLEEHPEDAPWLRDGRNSWAAYQKTKEQTP